MWKFQLKETCGAVSAQWWMKLRSRYLTSWPGDDQAGRRELRSWGESPFKWLDCCCSRGYKCWSKICCTEPGLTRPCVYCIYIKYMTCKMGGKKTNKQTKEKMDNGQLLLTDWLTRDRPDLSSERAPNKDNPAIFRQNKYLVASPKMGSTPRHTDWLTVSCNVTSDMS
jgi:hypothetical protein